MLEITDHPSPNFTERRGVGRPDMVVLHYTGMETCRAAAERLCDPAAEVSAHYLIDTDGTVLRLVADEMRAWHAGRSQWGAVTDVNSHSIGIELANPGHMLGYPPFPEAQMSALERLLAALVGPWGIAPERVVGHADVAPGRKIDPGEKLDWRRLAKQGLAVWLDWEVLPAAPGVTGEAGVFREAARLLGYAAPNHDHWSAEMLAVWGAFAMRFLPHAARGAPCADGVRHTKKLAARYPVDVAYADQPDQSSG